MESIQTHQEQPQSVAPEVSNELSQIVPINRDNRAMVVDLDALAYRSGKRQKLPEDNTHAYNLEWMDKNTGTKYTHTVYPHINSSELTKFDDENGTETIIFKPPTEDTKKLVVEYRHSNSDKYDEVDAKKHVSRIIQDATQASGFFSRSRAKFKPVVSKMIQVVSETSNSIKRRFAMARQLGARALSSVIRKP
jgi:hypothetical protein